MIVFSVRLVLILLPVFGSLYYLFFYQCCNYFYIYTVFEPTFNPLSIFNFWVIHMMFIYTVVTIFIISLVTNN